MYASLYAEQIVAAHDGWVVTQRKWRIVDPPLAHGRAAHLGQLLAFAVMVDSCELMMTGTGESQTKQWSENR